VFAPFCCVAPRECASAPSGQPLSLRAARSCFACATAQNARVYPRNMILLGLFTIAEGLFLGTMCAFLQGSAVLLGAGMCAGVVAGLTAFACTTKIDFTGELSAIFALLTTELTLTRWVGAVVRPGMGLYLFAALLVLLMFGFIASLFGAFGGGNWMQLLYACGGCLIFSMYLVYDTQLILGGQHKKFQFSVSSLVLQIPCYTESMRRQWPPLLLL
jgi:FtsH-binding integral membrane protein